MKPLSWKGLSGVALASTLLTLWIATSWAAKPDTSVPAKPEEHDSEGHPTDYKNPIRDGSVGGVPHYHVTICEGTTLGWNPWGSGHRNNEPQSDQSKNRDTTPTSSSGKSHAAASSAGGTDGQVAITGRSEGSTECTITLKEDDGTVRSLVVLVHVVRCTNANKGHRGVALGPVGLPGTPLESLIQESRIKIDVVGTGETIGHIADLKTENLTDQPINCAVPPMVLESKSGEYQDFYAAPVKENVALAPGATETIPMNGNCLERNKPPVDKGATGELIVNTGDPTVPRNPDSHIPPKEARELVRIVSAQNEAVDKVEEEGGFKDFPYHGKEKRDTIAKQWLPWMDSRISQITGSRPATKEDFKKVIYKQAEEHGPVTPETRRKIEKGSDAMWDGFELAGKKAKAKEKPDQYAGTPPGPVNISDNAASSAPAGSSTVAAPPNEKEKQPTTKQTTPSDYMTKELPRAFNSLPPGYKIVKTQSGMSFYAKWDGLRPGLPLVWDEKHGVWQPPGFVRDPSDPDRSFNQTTGQNAAWDGKSSQWIDTKTGKALTYEQ